jgi:hypothetical protein
MKHIASGVQHPGDSVGQTSCAVRGEALFKSVASQ